MRIRLPFAGVFFLLCLLAGYAGLSSLQLGTVINDKLLHTLTFFVLTVVFYWIIDTNRRRTLNLTVIVCTVVLGVGSEFLQGFLPNGREFDLYDIVANVVGSVAGLGLCTWYHMRMLERKRERRYNPIAGEDEADLELGEDLGQQEEGGMSAAGNERTTSLEQEVDNWDENAADDWLADDVEGDIGASNGKEPEQNSGDGAAVDNKKRVD
ncbi:Uu.00g145790.m01.CDS01 [Anthostomella pinea]|uniref:Uu.00g145790.m01.CDS01 n=1 Tax=Anthostomella pinea TaxID=933095 RepID=A0AAI8VS03_9PEZI|nr:Uu.00g145790.m01.CDS01 [Anthostomella pinea]